MTRIPLRALFATLVLLAAPHRSAADAPSASSSTLADSTQYRHWTLANGLRVVTRHIPGARSTAITLCYRLGSREDPKNREGQAELVCQAAFTGRCGDVPIRTPSELDQLRPGGWSVKVGPHLTEMTEACPRDLLPGVLHQVCQRFRGVVVSDTLLRRAREDVRRRLRENYDTRPEKTLYFLSGEMAAGGAADRAARYANGEGLGDLPAREISALLHERLVPANSVLCLVGDLEGFQIETLIDREMAGLAPGQPAAPIAWARLGPSIGTLVRPDLDRPIGVIGILGPALSDTLHPYFTAFTISTASLANKLWGRPDPPLSSRFQYSISTDPEVARFYPTMNDSVGPDRMLTQLFNDGSDAIVDSSAVEVAARSMLWLTGGPLPADLHQRALKDAPVIHTLATTLAALEAFGNEAFWTSYRTRLMNARNLDLRPLFGLYEDVRRRVVLVLRPARQRAESGTGSRR